MCIRDRSVLLLIRKLKGNVWFALLSFLYLYNYSVTWGFTGYTMGIPVLILILIKQYDYIRQPNLRDGILLSFFLILLFCIHGLITFFAIAILFTQIIFLNIKNPKRMILGSLALIPILVVAGFWLSSRAETSGGEGNMLIRYLQYYKQSFLPSLPRRIGFVYWDHSFLQAGKTGLWIGVTFSVGIIVMCTNFLMRPAITIKDKIKEPAFQFLFIILLVSSVIYCFIPSIANMLYFSYYRFSVFIFLSLILIGSLLVPEKYFKYKSAVFFFIALIHFGLWIDYFTDFQKNNLDFTPDLFPRNTRDKVLAGLMYDSLFRGQPVYMHMPNYFIIWNKGISANQFVEFPTPWVVGRKVGFDRLPSYQEWLWVSKNYRGQYSDVDYLLIRGKVPQNQLEYFKSFQVIHMQNEWILLKNQHNAPSLGKE